MKLPRVFVSTKLNVAQKIALDPAASRHLLQVLRLQLNDQLVIFNNTGGEFIAHLTAKDKQQAVVFLEEFVTRNNESPLTIHLGQGISRGEKMDFTVQKAVELGVATITPLFTTYCNVKLDEGRLEKRLTHWRGIATNAAEQSERCLVPEILPGQNLANWYKIQSSNLRLVFDPKATNKISSIKEQPQPPVISILVGPEGGLSDEEITLAKQNHFLPITLGPRILRTETAALTAISILQAKWGDL